ncbi:hypothetical protein ACHAXS_008511 [Conticribra weissflogii]
MTFSPTLGRNLQALNPLNLVNHHNGNTSPSPKTPVATTDDGIPSSNNAASPAETPRTPRENLMTKEGSTMVAMSNRPSESNAISQEVDDLYKEFEEFQTKLKSLVALHNDKHKSLKKLNDQMFGTAKFYKEMFANTPIHSVVTENGCSASLFASAPSQDLFPDIPMEQPAAAKSETKSEERREDHLNLHREMIEETSYPDAAIFRDVKVKDPDGKKSHGKSVKVSSHSVTEATKKVNLEPEGEEQHGKSIESDGDFDKIGLQGVEVGDTATDKKKVNVEPGRDQNNGKSNQAYSESSRVDLEPEGGETRGNVSQAGLYSDIDADKRYNSPKEPEGEKDCASSIKITDTSVALKKKESIDPPSTMEYPHDEIDDDGNKAVIEICSQPEDSVNVIVSTDDDSESTDSSHSERDHESEDGLESNGGREKGCDVFRKEKTSPSKEDEEEKVESESKEAENFKSFDEILESRSVDSFVEDEVGATDTKTVEGVVEEVCPSAFPAVLACDESEIVIENGIDGRNIDDVSSNTPNENTACDSDVGRSSSEGASKVDTPKSSVISYDPDSTFSSPGAPSTDSRPPESYFDVHSAAHINSEKFLQRHKNLVNYLEEWENTISTRVKARYGEYVKFRKNLHHYIKKVNSLKSEHRKLEEKNKPIKPKQEEKMERNILKLSGARETHDSAGESLILLLDEIVHRSWKDVFPLIKMSMQFEAEYSAMQAKIFERLNETSKIMSNIGVNESLSNTSRLEALRTMNPEVLYTGQKGKGIGLPVLVE